MRNGYLNDSDGFEEWLLSDNGFAAFAARIENLKHKKPPFRFLGNGG